MNPIQKIEVRCVFEKNKPRLRTDTNPAFYVHAGPDWREYCARGAVMTIFARLRSDKTCYVMQPLFMGGAA